MRARTDWRELVAAAGALALSALVIGSALIAPRLRAQAPTGQTPATQTPAAQTSVPQWQIDAGGKMAFDVASVKASKSNGGGHNNLGQPGGHVSMTDAPLRNLIAQAYRFTNLSDATNLIFGIPAWGFSEHFDVEAEAPGNPTVDQKRLMLQSLLADRFHLLVHREIRQMSVYAVVLAKPGKPGPQLRAHTDDAECGDSSAGSGGAQPNRGGSASSISPETPDEAAAALLRKYPCGRAEGGLLTPDDHDDIWAGGRKMDMSAIAESFGGMVAMDRPIIDRTGLGGLFDFTLEWNHQLDALSVNPAADISGMSLIDALREQLGIKLESTTGPVNVLVIDHVEKPFEN